MKPEILILLSTYNGEKYLSTQIDSIIEQKDVNIRFFIRDDGSTDATIKILEEYKLKYPDKFSVIKGHNIGFVKSFSLLINESINRFKEINYFAFSDQDDFWLPNKLSKAIEILKDYSDNKPSVYCSNLIISNSKLQPLRYKYKNINFFINKYNCLIQNYGVGCTMVFNRKTVETFAKINPTNINYHDHYIYKLCMFLGNVIYDNESYILYRQHEHNVIGAPNFLTRTLKRLKLKWLYQHPLENANTNFLNDIRSLLISEDIRIIETFILYKKNFITRINLLFNFKYRYKLLGKDLLFRIRIILGTV